MSAFKKLSEVEEVESRNWARTNIKFGITKVSSEYHPIVRDEYLKMCNEVYPDITFGHFGNGIVVYDKHRQVDNDYYKLAFINSDRIVKPYGNLTFDEKQYVFIYAITADPNISATQSEKVFNTKPN